MRSYSLVVGGQLDGLVYFWIGEKRQDGLIEGGIYLFM